MKIKTENQNIAILNEVQAFLIGEANAKGICLASEFESVEDFKKFVVGFAFKGLRAAGADVATAYEACLGEGSYTKLVSKTCDI
jgi:hypothetical protein